MPSSPVLPLRRAPFLVLRPDRDDDADPSFESMHGLYWLLVNLSADRPLLVAIDDLPGHWCDLALSLRFLTYLAPQSRVCRCSSSRRCARHCPVYDAVLFDEIAGDHLTVGTRVGPLSEASAAALVRQRLGEEVVSVFSVACHAATGGNPLLLDELSKALAAEGVRPDSAHVGMVADLGPTAVSRSGAATTAPVHRRRRSGWRGPPPCSATELISGSSPRSAGLTTDEVVRGASALVQAEILRPGEPIAFVHPLVGGAVYADLSPLGRATEHEPAAALLSARGAPAEQVAAHLEKVEGHGDAAAVDTLLPRRPRGDAPRRRRECGRPPQPGTPGATAASAAACGAPRARPCRGADPRASRRGTPGRGVRNAR